MLHNRVGLAPGIDLRGDGGYVLAPRWIDASGGPYRWEYSADVCSLASLPDWTCEVQKEHGRRDHPLSHCAARCEVGSRSVSETKPLPPTWPDTCCGAASIPISQPNCCSYGMRHAAALRWGRRRWYAPSHRLSVSISRAGKAAPDVERSCIEIAFSTVNLSE